MYPTWSDILSERRKLQLIILNNIVNFRRNVSTYSKIDHETSYDSKLFWKFMEIVFHEGNKTGNSFLKIA